MRIGISRRWVAAGIVCLAMGTLLLSSCAGDSNAVEKTKAAAKPATDAIVAAPADDAHHATAVFAGGCFWCMETAYEGKPGIAAVVSGFAGGELDHPTYNQVSAGGTGHAEVVQVQYDPSVTNYEQLLDIFWHNIDPTQANGQFCDRGSQYRSAIFYGNEEEKRLAEASKEHVAAQLKRTIVTEIVPATEFFPAEDYHQDFWKKDPVRYFSYRKGCGRDARLKEIWGKAPDVAH